MKPDPDRQALIDQSIARFRKLLEEQLPDDNATLDQIEQAIDKIGKDILPVLQEKVANKRSKKPRDNKIDCSCGGHARVACRNGRLLPFTACLSGYAPHIIVVPARRAVLRWTLA